VFMHIDSQLSPTSRACVEQAESGLARSLSAVSAAGTDDIRIVHTESRIEIHLNRPDKKNALTAGMYAVMADTLEAADADDSILSVIITANGTAFCAGNDLRDFMINPPSGGDSPVNRFLAAISTTSTVVIAAIQGAAVGIGATMLLHCDHIVAAEDAFLQFSFVKMALVPEAASSLLLPHAVGPLRAAEYMLTGRAIPAPEALAVGLVSTIVAVGDQLAAAQLFADRLSDLPPEALRLTKQLLRSDDTGVSDRMAREGSIFSARLASLEFAEAARAFAEKRPPRFQDLSAL
jgi:enoyl-CoA hydratase/carnithine racemase